MEKYLKTIIRYFLLIIVFLLPLFFLPLTQEFFITNKFYLLIFFTLLLFLISSIQFLITKKIFWQSFSLDLPIFIFLLTLSLSLIFSSTNKIQALLNPNFGLGLFIALTILYFYLSRQKSPIINQLLNYSIPFSSLILSLLAVFFFFQPFKNLNLPQSLQFLKNPYFTPLGSQLDLAIFLGLVVLIILIKIIHELSINQQKSPLIVNYLLLIINLLGLSLTIYLILKPPANANQLPPSLLSPFRLSWYAAVEVLKNPLSALFGIGIDNFSSIFTKVKDLAYNQSSFWQINFFNLSRSALLHILTETGIFGITAFILLLFSIFRQLISTTANKSQLILFAYLFFCLLFFPSSLIIWFLFFVSIGTLEQKSTSNFSEVNFAGLLPFYFGILIIFYAVIGFCGYYLGRSYAAEYFYKKSLDGFAQNNAKQVYDNMRQAIILNPYLEKYRIDFSQINLLIANNIAAKANQPQGKDKTPYQLTETDRQNIGQAIQAAIDEAKAAITLNAQKAVNWENLALIYRNIINVAQGADVWTVSAYQRAIILDPQNPVYRLNLGGIYYSLGNFEEAVKIFEQAVVLKPDWVNAHYNLAWGDYQRGNYQRAVSEMQNVLSLLDPQKEKGDYDRIKKELEEFKKKLPAEESSATQSSQPSQLSLPTPPPATLEPKLKLPETAFPEAK